MNELVIKAEEAYLKGSPDEAVGLLARVLEAEPENTRALSNIGVIFHALSRFQDARTALEKALSLEPANSEMRKNLVLTLLSLKDFAAARTELETLLASNQIDYQLWNLLSKVDTALGNTQGALAAAERSLLLNPAQPDLVKMTSSLKAQSAAPGAAAPVRARTKNLFIFSSPDRESETDLLSEELAKHFRLERVSSVKMDPYQKSARYADIIWLDGLTDTSLFFLGSKGALADKTVLLRLTRADMQRGDLASISYEAAGHLCFESFYFRDAFLRLSPKITPGTSLHAFRRCVDAKTYACSERTGRDAVCSVLSETASPGEVILLLEAFLAVLKENPEAVLRVRHGARDLSGAGYLGHFLSLNGIEQKVLFHPPGGTLKAFLEKSDYFLSTEVSPGAPGILEALALGLKPLIRFTCGQNEYAPEGAMWKNLSEIPRFLSGFPDPKETSERVISNFSPQKVAELYVTALLSGKPRA